MYADGRFKNVLFYKEDVIKHIIEKNTFRVNDCENSMVTLDQQYWKQIKI